MTPATIPERIHEYGGDWPTIPPERLSPRLQLASYFVCPPPFAPLYRITGVHLFLILGGRVRDRLPDGTWLQAGPGMLVCPRAGGNHLYEVVSDEPLTFFQLHMQASSAEPTAVPWLPGFGPLPWIVDMREYLDDATRLFNRAIELLVQLPPTLELDAAAMLHELLSLTFLAATGGTSPAPQRLNRWETLLVQLEKRPEMTPVTELAADFGMSPEHFIREFRAYVGHTPKKYMLQRRLWRARQMLEAGRSIKEAAFAVGFHDAQHFSRMYRRLFGYSPSRPPVQHGVPQGPPAMSLPVGRHLFAPGLDIHAFRPVQ